MSGIHLACFSTFVIFASLSYNPGFFRAEERELFLRVIPDTNYYCVTEPLYFCTEYDRFNKKRRFKRLLIIPRGGILMTSWTN